MLDRKIRKRVEVIAVEEIERTIEDCCKLSIIFFFLLKLEWIRPSSSGSALLYLDPLCKVCPVRPPVVHCSFGVFFVGGDQKGKRQLNG